MRAGIQTFSLVLCTAVLAVAGTFYFLKVKTMTRVHELEFPLMLQSSVATGSSYLLPKGTMLYFDKSYPEGFTRFRVYINVDGIRLETRELADPTLISPLTAFPVDKAELGKLLHQHPITKEDLRTILGSQQLTKDEIRSLLEEFSR